MMFEYIEALNPAFGSNRDRLFVAGGVTDCPDWQKELIDQLRNKPISVFNPRRTKFPIHDPAAAEAQIVWEHEHLRQASAIAFWFPCETLCPIALYELGQWSVLPATIFVGVHPDYKRKSDVIIQTRLVRPRLEVVFSIPELAAQVRNWAA